MSTQKIPILLNCLAAFAGAVGQYLYKKGGVKIATEGGIMNTWIVAGVIMFCAVMALFVISYKLGGRISVVYPFYATTFVWGTLIGVGIEREPWRAIQLAGLALVLVGVAIIAWFSEVSA